MNDSDFTYDTAAEADKGFAAVVGTAQPEKAWILTDRDVWEPNPSYTGLPVPHPEEYGEALDCGYEGDYEHFVAEYRANLAKPAEASEAKGDDNCPF